MSYNFFQLIYRNFKVPYLAQSHHSQQPQRHMSRYAEPWLWVNLADFVEQTKCHVINLTNQCFMFS